MTDLTDDQGRSLELAKKVINDAAAKIIKELEEWPYRLRASEFRADFHLSCIGPTKGHAFGQPLRVNYPIYRYSSGFNADLDASLRVGLAEDT